MTRWFLWIILLSSGYLQAEMQWQDSRSGGFAVEMKVSATETEVPNPIGVELELTYPTGYHVDSESLKENLLRHSLVIPAPFVLKSIDAPERQEQEGSVKQKITFTLEPQLPGNFPLTFYKISILPDDKERSSVEFISNIFDITIKSSPVTEIREVRIGPLLKLSPNFPIEISRENLNVFDESVLHKEAYRNQEIFRDSEFPWIGLAIVALVLILFWAGIVSRPALGKMMLPEQRAELARKRALESLKQLESRPKKTPEECAAYYVDLTNTMRAFIEEKFQLHPSTQTTQEFLEDLTTSKAFDAQMRSHLSQFLISADRVKFAKKLPSSDECQQAQNLAEKLILGSVLKI